MTKQEIYRKFKKEKLAIFDSYCVTTLEEEIKRDNEVVSLCDRYLSSYPEMNDTDCHRAFYPVNTLMHTKRMLKVKEANL